MDMTKSFEIVVAATRTTWGIGKSGGLPWRLPGDMAFFKEASLATAAASTDADRSNDDALVQARKSKGRTWSDVDMVDSSQNGGGGGDGGDNEAYQRKRRNSEGNQNDYAAASMSAIVTG